VEIPLFESYPIKNIFLSSQHYFRCVLSVLTELYLLMQVGAVGFS